MRDLRVCWPVLGHSRIYLLISRLRAHPGPGRISRPTGQTQRGLRARGQPKWCRKRRRQAASGQCPRGRTSADDKQRRRRRKPATRREQPSPAASRPRPTSRGSFGCAGRPARDPGPQAQGLTFATMRDLRVCWPVLGHSRIYLPISRLRAHPGPGRISRPTGQTQSRGRRGRRPQREKRGAPSQPFANLFTNIQALCP